MGETAVKVDRLHGASDGSSDIYGLIHGPLPNKSNSRRLVMFGKRAAFVKSKEALEYERRFRVAVLGSSLTPLVADKLFLKITVFQENLRRDLDCELLPDLLQKCGVILNDRHIWRKEYERQLDKENPRVEFKIGILAP